MKKKMKKTRIKIEGNIYKGDLANESNVENSIHGTRNV